METTRILSRRNFAKLLAASPLALLTSKVGQAAEEQPVKVLTDVRLHEVSVVKDNVFGTKLEVGYDHAGYYLPDFGPTYVDDYGNWIRGEWLARTRDSHEYLLVLEPFKNHFIDEEGYFNSEYDINPIYVRGELSGQYLASFEDQQQAIRRELTNAKYGLYRCFEQAVKDNIWLLHTEDSTVPRDRRNFYAPLDLPRFGIEQYDFKLDLPRIAQL